MKVSDVLNKACIIAELKAHEKTDILDEMTTELSSKVDGIDREKLLEALLEREKLGSTGIGHGVAIPHAKLKGIDEVQVAFGRSRRGVEFHSMDSRPVHIFFLIVAPENTTVTHLKILSSISRILKDNGFRKKLLEAEGAEDIYRIIAEEDNKVIKGAVI